MLPFIDLAAQQARIRPALDARMARVLDHGQYILGPEVAQFEEELSAFCGARHVLSCANGTDALLLALMALQVRPGQAIFCPSFTFAATAEVMPCMGAAAFFVDVDPGTFNMDAASLVRSIEAAKEMGLEPAGVIPVDLFGLPADYAEIEPIAQQHNLWIIADTAQGFGARYHNRMTGTIGTFATTSFFPAKPLGAYGDGGALFTDDDDLAALVRSLRVHGQGTDKYDNPRIGMNSRLDTLQATILSEKLTIFPDEITRRQRVADRYASGLSDLVGVPVIPEGLTSVWAQYTIRLREGQDRTALQAGLREAGIPSVIYYAVPLHRQGAYQHFPKDPSGLPATEQLADEVLSLPMHPYLESADQERIISTIRSVLT